MSGQYEISVRQMVEFILRRGDIDSTGALFGTEKALKRAWEGTRLHQKLQQEAIRTHPDYQSEVSLSRVVSDPPVQLLVTGRADGLYTDPERGVPVIEEIKSVEEKVDQIQEETYPLHWAQACCYGAMLEDGTNTGKIDICLVYIHHESQNVRRLTHSFSRTELEAVFEKLTGSLVIWLKKDLERKSLRDQTLVKLSFPFGSYRKGQRSMIASVYTDIMQKRRAFYQAPTGIGKTMSVLFPAVRALERGAASKIFYLTARHTAGACAEEAAALLQKNGCRMKAVRLTARDTICPLEKRSCSPSDCPRAKGHYDRINQVVMDLIGQKDLLTEEVISRRAEEENVCPFELSLDLASWCDLIICDYNYVFDPDASLKRFFGEGKKDFIVLVDEAHNLVDRARTMFSASLVKSDFLKAAKLLKKERAQSAVKAANAVNRVFLSIKKELPDKQPLCVIDPPQDSMIRALDRFCEALEELFSGRKQVSEELRQLYFDTRAFISVAKKADENYIIYAFQTAKDVTVHLYCYHPASQLEEVYDRLNSIIFFSATLMPVEYYQEFLGVRPPHPARYLSSPFDPDHRLVLVDDTLDVSYRYREESASEVAFRIHQFVHARPGGYLIFFPSFAYLNVVAQIYQAHDPQDDVTLQTPDMTQNDRMQILDRFQDDGRLRIVMAVMGGVFSEGVDLKGDRLIGAAVISVGLPQMGFERDQIRARMDAAGKNGFDYAYRYPGINKVLQAAGRVIRSEEDRGVILLIDARYSLTAYRNLIPGDYFPMKRVDRQNIEETLHTFWTR